MWIVSLLAVFLHLLGYGKNGWSRCCDKEIKTKTNKIIIEVNNYFTIYKKVARYVELDT